MLEKASNTITSTGLGTRATFNDEGGHKISGSSECEFLVQSRKIGRRVFNYSLLSF